MVIVMALENSVLRPNLVQKIGSQEIGSFESQALMSAFAALPALNRMSGVAGGILQFQKRYEVFDAAEDGIPRAKGASHLALTVVNTFIAVISPRAAGIVAGTTHSIRAMKELIEVVESDDPQRKKLLDIARCVYVLANHLIYVAALSSDSRILRSIALISQAVYEVTISVRKLYDQVKNPAERGEVTVLAAGLQLAVAGFRGFAAGTLIMDQVKPPVKPIMAKS